MGLIISIVSIPRIENSIPHQIVVIACEKKCFDDVLT